MVKTISRILIFAMLHLCWLTSNGYAEMVPTESTIEQPSQDEADRQRILDLLNRKEVINELEKYGITKVEAVARINSLTNEEITSLNNQIDQLPTATGAAAAAGLLGPLIFFCITSCSNSSCHHRSDCKGYLLYFP